jgi:hypothetical protein
LPILADLKVLVEQDYENGYIKITLDGTPVTGKFELVRKSDNDTRWYKIADIEMSGESNLSDFTWQDLTVEHGVEYIYAIRRANPVSKKICSKPIIAFFEDMYLSDSKKQLKIRFNPKVSSFKNTVLE